MAPPVFILHFVRSTWLSLGLIGLIGLTSTAPSAAQTSITVVNPSFEDISGETPVNEFTFGPLLGWDLYDPGAITNGGAGNTYFIGTLTPFFDTELGAYRNFPAGAADGQRVAIAFNSDGSEGGGEYGLVQTLAATLQANLTYTLQVDIGNIATGQAIEGTTYFLDGFPGYRVDLLAGGVVLASDNNSLAGTIPEGEFATSTLTFSVGGTHAQLGQTLGIRLVNLNFDNLPPDNHSEVDFDNVQLTAVPEPGTSALLFGGAALAALMLRRRHQG